MRNRTTLITGGCGFLGVSVATRLLAMNTSWKIVLADLVRHTRMERISSRIQFAEANISNQRECEELVTPDVDTVYHFASLVSGGAERDFAGGLNANVYATINMLESCRKQGNCPRFIFPSSIATFGGQNLPAVVDDSTCQPPQNSYGVAKVVGEQTLNDYSRKGFIDGRGVRLPAIVVRDEANTAASGYASALVREPIAGHNYVCPVPPDTRMPILSSKKAVEVLISLSELPKGSLGDYRTINGPSISPSAAEIANAIKNCGVPNLGSIAFHPDPNIIAIVVGWPTEMRYDRAKELGFGSDPSIEAIVADYIQGKPYV